MPKKAQKFRTEKDFLGDVKIPADSLYGTTSVRALDNFQISGTKAPAVFMEALGIVKLAAAKSNFKLGLIPARESKALIQACQEFVAGKFVDDFAIDVFQAGAGTSYNMNANEIIANRANQILKAPLGSYLHIHPNNHVNMAQSTNDVIPTATRLAALFLTPDLLSAIKSVEETLTKKARQYKSVTKVGRTHFQDAVPISFSQEFDSYKEALAKSRKFIEQQSQELQILGIGGTAVGTGITAHPKYKSTVISELTTITNIDFTASENATEIANNMTAFLNFSSALRSLSTNLLNLASDLKFMSSGPLAGIGEITLPAVQPGSSIMPGKINPSILEALEMICLQVLGNDKTIESACTKSHLELNVFCPLIMYNLLQSIQILTNGLHMLNNRCLKYLTVNEPRVRELFEHSLCTATALTPHLGYQLTAEVVKSALQNHRTIKQEVLHRKLLTEKQLDKILQT